MAETFKNSRYETVIYNKVQEVKSTKKSKAKLALYDSLTLKAKYNDGWSKWQSKSGSLYVFKHLPASDKQKAPVAQVYKDRKYFSGVFRTKEPREFSGDMLDKNTGERVFLLFSFDSDKVRIFKRLN